MDSVRKEIYMDYAATTPVTRRVFEAMKPCFMDEYGNPSSTHKKGCDAANLVFESREKIGGILGCEPEEVVFTSGGSEANNQAIMTAAKYGMAVGKKHIVTSAIEHHSVLETLEALEREHGFEITKVGVDKGGHVKLDEIIHAINDNTILVSLMFINNEIGSIQPIDLIGKVCGKLPLFFHVDAVQAAGHEKIDVKKNCINFLSISGHKFGAPKGIGALIYDKNSPPFSLIYGGAQENGLRAGTQNVPGIVGMGVALEESFNWYHTPSNYNSMLHYRDELVEELLKISGSHLNGSLFNRACNNVSVSFEGVLGEMVVFLLSQQGIYISSGSACTSGSLEPSHVLTSLGLDDDLARGAIRITLGPSVTHEEVSTTVDAIKKAVTQLREGNA